MTKREMLHKREMICTEWEVFSRWERSHKREVLNEWKSASASLKLGQ